MRPDENIFEDLDENIFEDVQITPAPKQGNAAGKAAAKAVARPATKRPIGASGSWPSEDELTQERISAAEQERTKAGTSKAKTAVSGYLQGMVADGADEIGGSLYATGEGYSSAMKQLEEELGRRPTAEEGQRVIPQQYREARDFNRGAIRADQKANPNTYAVSYALGALLGPGKVVAPVKTFKGTLAALAGIGGLIGANASESSDPKEIAKQAVGTGALSAGTGGLAVRYPLAFGAPAAATLTAAGGEIGMTPADRIMTALGGVGSGIGGYQAKRAANQSRLADDALATVNEKLDPRLEAMRNRVASTSDSIEQHNLKRPAQIERQEGVVASASEKSSADRALFTKAREERKADLERKLLAAERALKQFHERKKVAGDEHLAERAKERSALEQAVRDAEEDLRLFQAEKTEELADITFAKKRQVEKELNARLRQALRDDPELANMSPEARRRQLREWLDEEGRKYAAQENEDSRKLRKLLSLLTKRKGKEEDIARLDVSEHAHVMRETQRQMDRLRTILHDVPQEDWTDKVSQWVESRRPQMSKWADRVADGPTPEEFAAGEVARRKAAGSETLKSVDEEIAFEVTQQAAGGTRKHPREYVSKEAFQQEARRRGLVPPEDPNQIDLMAEDFNFPLAPDAETRFNRAVADRARRLGLLVGEDNWFKYDPYQDLSVDLRPESRREPVAPPPEPAPAPPQANRPDPAAPDDFNIAKRNYERAKEALAAAEARYNVSLEGKPVSETKKVQDQINAAESALEMAIADLQKHAPDLPDADDTNVIDAFLANLTAADPDATRAEGKIKAKPSAAGADAALPPPPPPTPPKITAQPPQEPPKRLLDVEIPRAKQVDWDRRYLEHTRKIRDAEKALNDLMAKGQDIPESLILKWQHEQENLEAALATAQSNHKNLDNKQILALKQRADASATRLKARDAMLKRLRDYQRDPDKDPTIHARREKLGREQTVLQNLEEFAKPENIRSRGQRALDEAAGTAEHSRPDSVYDAVVRRLPVLKDMPYKAVLDKSPEARFAFYSNAAEKAKKRSELAKYAPMLMWAATAGNAADVNEFVFTRAEGAPELAKALWEAAAEWNQGK